MVLSFSSFLGQFFGIHLGHWWWQILFFLPVHPDPEWSHEAETIGGSDQLGDLNQQIVAWTFYEPLPVFLLFICHFLASLRRILESDSASCQISPSTSPSWSHPSKQCLEWDQLSHSVSVVKRTYTRPTYRRPKPLNWIFISSPWISISWIFNYLYDCQCLPNVRSAHLCTFYQALVLICKYSSADLMHFFPVNLLCAK